jgi:hypothetical protein
MRSRTGRLVRPLSKGLPGGGVGRTREVSAVLTTISVASLILSAVGVGLGLASFILVYGRRRR